LAVAERISRITKSGIREIFDLAQGLPNVINFGIGEPDFRTPEFINEAAKKAIDDGLSKYTMNIGLPELREEISIKLKRDNGVDVNPEKEIIVTSGATQGIFIVMNCLLDEGDEVLLPSPIFTAYHYSAMIAGGTPIEVPLDERYHLDFDKLERSATKRSKILVLGSPSNPTGTVFDEKEIRRLCEFASDKDLYLISDEIYERFLYDGVTHFSPACLPEFKNRIVTVNGFSKSYAMTGWRLGYCAANDQVISALTKYNMYNAVCASSIAQLAGLAALRGPQSYFEAILREFATRRDIVCEKLDELDLNYVRPKGSIYVFPKIPRLEGSLEFCRNLLLQHHVMAAPGSAFGHHGEGHFGLQRGDSRNLPSTNQRVSNPIRSAK